MKNITVGIIIGVCLTITVTSVYIMFRMNARLVNLEGFALQVTSLINNSQQLGTK